MVTDKFDFNDNVNRERTVSGTRVPGYMGPYDSVRGKVRLGPYDLLLGDTCASSRAILPSSSGLVNSQS
eukprot:1079276-Rhodomonas_salina.3